MISPLWQADLIAAQPAVLIEYIVVVISKNSPYIYISESINTLMSVD